MRVALVSEHASPLAVLGGVDAGGQNVHVAALACALARRGAQVVVHTRRDDPDLPRRVALCDGRHVDHIDAGPPAAIAKDELFPHMDAFARELQRCWREDRPDLVHSHFWMSGLAALQAARELELPVVHTFHALGIVKRRYQGDADTSPPQRVELERELVARCDRIVATCTDEAFELDAARRRPLQDPRRPLRRRPRPLPARRTGRGARRSPHRIVYVGPPGRAQGHRQRHQRARARAGRASW